MTFPVTRLRRLRRSTVFRRLARETHLQPSQLILPLFAVPGQGVEREVSSMPGVFQQSPDRLAERAREAFDEGISGVLLFGIPAHKDSEGSSSWQSDGVVQRALEALAEAVPQMVRIVDLCFCEYTDHGHCGVLTTGTPESITVDNDPTLENLQRQALSLVDAGAQVIAPSDMMDGRVGALRRALDAADHGEVAILSYAVKYASAFYGPFRDAAESTPSFGDRRSYQMDPSNRREAIREAALDVEEGADALMVKPALPYLDIVADLRRRFDLPLAAYHVSGEYSMLHAAAQKGWLDYDRTLMESLLSIRRAGADWIITYGARDAVRLLQRGWEP
ncbi:MAG: porphobilinogen synthase [Acidobacteriota bacterium]